MNIEIANRLQKLRKEKGYSQEQLAEELGISRQAVSKWERAEASPDTDNLICLAKLYGISLDELLNSDETVEEIRQNTIEINENNKQTASSVVININDDDEDDDEPDDDEEYDGEDKEGSHHVVSSIVSGTIALVVVIAYLLMGFLWDLWSVGWTLFLLIPIVPSIFHAIRTKKATRFAYPVFVTFIYLTLGMTIGYWHPLWVLFLTIPIYYTIFGEIEKAKREKTN